MDLKFMLTNEVMKMKDILEQSGFDVDIASLSGENLSNDGKGYRQQGWHSRAYK